MPEKSPEEALAEPMPNPVLLLAEFHQEPFCLGFGKFFVEPLTLRYILSEDFVETGNFGDRTACNFGNNLNKNLASLHETPSGLSLNRRFIF